MEFKVIVFDSLHSVKINSAHGKPIFTDIVPCPHEKGEKQCSKRDTENERCTHPVSLFSGRQGQNKHAQPQEYIPKNIHIYFDP